MSEIEAELRGACARMEGWALACCGNLEETGKTVSVLEGLCGLTGSHQMPPAVVVLVRGLLGAVRSAVRERYGVHLAPL